MRLPTQHWDALLIYMISTKLDKITACAWEKEKTDNEIPTIDDLKRFLKNRVDMLETLEINNLQIDKNTKMKPLQSIACFVMKITIYKIVLNFFHFLLNKDKRK